MNDKYLSEGFEGDLPTQLSVKKTAQRVLLNLLISILIVLCASALRLVFFASLGRTTPHLTYYPAVMIAALIGGLSIGVITTFLSVIVVFIWVKQGQMSSPELWAMAFFAVICTTISWLSEERRRANKRVQQMKERPKDLVDERTEKLRQSEEHFRSIVEQSPLAFVRMTPEGQITDVNPAWMRQWDLGEEEKAEVFAAYNMRTDKQLEDLGLAPLVERAFAGESVVLPPIEYNGNRSLDEMGLEGIEANTRWIQCHMYPVKDENGSVAYLININEDITDRKKIELEVQEMASFAELNPAPVLRVNPEGIIVSCNPAALDVLGKNIQKGASICSILPRLSKADIKKYINGNVILTHEVYAQGKYYLFALRGVRDLNLLHLYGSDITQRKKIEEEATQLREEYLHIARVVAIGELAASIAHELKQPLAAIRSNAQAAQRFLTGINPDLDEFHAILTDIIKDNRRADEVIGRLRTLVRREEFQVTELNINELIQELFPLIFSYELLRKISLEFEPDDRLPSVSADRVQLQQVILNLLLNSSEALMSESGDMRKITILTRQNDAHAITVAVKDNGPGLNEQKVDHLFEPFYTTKKEGLGMGLAICRSIVEAHRGRLWAENNADRGVTFYFTIPVFKGSLA